MTSKSSLKTRVLSLSETLWECQSLFSFLNTHKIFDFMTTQKISVVQRNRTYELFHHPRPSLLDHIHFCMYDVCPYTHLYKLIYSHTLCTYVFMYFMHLHICTPYLCIYVCIHLRIHLYVFMCVSVPS